MSYSQALTKRSADVALMPPPPPPKRIKRPSKVLDEDTYTDALSRIIARDFFPGLVQSESQQEYLDALDSKDLEWIATAGKKLTEVMIPGPDGRRVRGRRGTSMTPLSGLHGQGGETPLGWAGETPGSVISTTSTTTPSKPEVDINLSLGAFQAKYTSEDNESFYKLIDRQNQKRREKYAWMYAGNKIPAARQIAYRKQQASIATAESEQEATDGTKALSIVRKDTRKAMPDSWKPSGANTLMFAPDPAEDASTLAEDKSRAPPKSINHDNTRLPTLTSDSTDDNPKAPGSPTLSAIREAIAGHPRLAASEIDANSTHGYDGSMTPRVNGYAFVDSEDPSPPSTPSTTHRIIDLGPGDATPNPFTIKENSKREALHHRMVDKVARGKRTQKADREISTPIIGGSSTPKLNRVGLTPAAQRLLGNVGNRTPGRDLWQGKGITTPSRKSMGLVTPRKG